jgi:hypothetical protein
MVDPLLHRADHHRERVADNRPDFVPAIDDHHSLLNGDARPWLKKFTPEQSGLTW